MRILKKRLKEGTVKLKIEGPEDLWHLQKILEAGDIITGKTKRKTTIKRQQEIDYGERKPVILSIELEKFSYHKETSRLRLAGRIVSGPEDIQLSSHHTMDAKAGVALQIRKQWKRHQLERLEKARTKGQRILICLIDREEADFAGYSDEGLEMLASISFKKVSREKEQEESKSAFYRQVSEYLQQKEGYSMLIIAGPGFERENFLEYLKENRNPLASKALMEHSSYIGISGAKEVIKKSANRILRTTRIAMETDLVENLLKEIARPEGKAVYGEKETRKAIEYGAVEILLISEEKMMDYKELIDAAEKISSRIVFISSDHESGEKLLHLGGIAGMLRFRVDY